MSEYRNYTRKGEMAFEAHFHKHVSAMTIEGLHSKFEIACELAYRDQQIEALQAEVAALKGQIESARNQPPAGHIRFGLGSDFVSTGFADYPDAPDGTWFPLYAAPLPPVLRELSNQELLRLFEIFCVHPTQPLVALVRGCIKAAGEAA